MPARRGLTAFEVLISTGIFAVLIIAILSAADPLRKYQTNRDAIRQADIEKIATAIRTDQVDNGGSYLQNVAGLKADEAYQVGTAAAGCNLSCAGHTTQSACVDLTPLAIEGYLTSVPMDPNSGTSIETNYYVIRQSSGEIEVGACRPEISNTLMLTK